MFRKLIGSILIAGCVTLCLSGCGNKKADNSTASENVVTRQVHQNLPKTTPSAKESKAAKSPDAQQPVKGEQTREAVHGTEEETAGAEEIIEENQAPLQIVFLGDDVFDTPDKINKIPELTELQCNAQVYNLAMKGTSASLFEEDDITYEGWTSKSLVGVVNVMKGTVPGDLLEDTSAEEAMEENIDFSRTDYFVIGYGLHDFLRGVPQSNKDQYYDLTTYAGAYRYAVDTIRELAPDATIILCSPGYAQFFEDGIMTGDGNTLNQGNGTLFDYKGTCEYIAGEKQTEFMNAYEELGINGYTAEDYLEDGVHLTAAGRQLYADLLSRIILNHETTKNN